MRQSLTPYWSPLDAVSHPSPYPPPTGGGGTEKTG